MNANLQIKEALRIVGPADFSADGESGRLTIDGPFAVAIVNELWSSDEYRSRHGLNDQPVRLSRMGGLEIWCNGAYIEGPAVRHIIHRAAQTLQGSAPLGAEG